MDSFGKMAHMDTPAPTCAKTSIGTAAPTDSTSTMGTTAPLCTAAFKGPAASIDTAAHMDTPAPKCAKTSIGTAAPTDNTSTMGIRFSIVTCSSTRTHTEDTAGAALEESIRKNGWVVLGRVVVPDDRTSIGEAIIEATESGADIVLTCGGSGLSLADVTPEATADVCQRYVPGIAEAMRAASLKITGRAMLSRAVCMQRGKTLVVNLPGSLKAATECFNAVYEQFEHAVRMTAGEGH